MEEDSVLFFKYGCLLPEYTLRIGVNPGQTKLSDFPRSVCAETLVG